MSADVALDTRPSAVDGGDWDPDLTHVFCTDCDPEGLHALCGIDLDPDEPIVDDPTDDLCVVCDDLESLPCERCGA